MELIISPKKKHPMKFTKITPIGNGKKLSFSIISDKYDLDRAPKAPPMPIRINFIFLKNGGPSATRTQDQFVKSELLYRLS